MEIFNEKPKKMLDFCWNCLKSEWVTRLGYSEWFLIALLNPLCAGKIEKHSFGDSKNSTNFQHQ